MRFLKRIFDFYIEGSIHVAIAVCSFAWMSFSTFERPVVFPFLGFLFLGTITGYNFVKYASLAGFHHRSLTKNIREIQLFSFFVFLGFLYVFFTMPRVIQTVSFVFGLLTLFYIVPFIKSYSLRNLWGIKIFVVAFVWAGVTVVLPWLFYPDLPLKGMWVVFIQRFLWVLVLTLPFEIRDLVYDRPNLGTIPQRLGVHKTHLAGLALLALIILLEAFIADSRWGEELLFAGMLGVTGIFLIISNKDQSPYFTAFWVESIPIVWWSLYQLL